MGRNNDILSELIEDQKALRRRLKERNSRETYYKIKLKKRFGESAYTFHEISESLIHLGFYDCTVENIIFLPVEITYSGVFNDNSERRREGLAFVLKSNLPKILEAFDLPIDANDFELSAKDLGYEV
ncbi:hypothetical protein HY212_06200 [Candidatus Pacearchaeota archaeon]|nr:hypothetical protein [Candidatus Pacearchaeota archaeon]